MSETIIGGSAIKPIYEWVSIRWLHLAVLGEVNGRFVGIRGDTGQSVPSIASLYTNATAPGLTNQPGSIQTGEGLRIMPVFGNFELIYVAKFQQFIAPSDSQSSFLRWTVDLNHTYYLYGYARSAPRSTETVGPDSCVSPPGSCPSIPKTRNLSGSIGVRLLLSESNYSATSAVPVLLPRNLRRTRHQQRARTRQLPRLSISWLGSLAFARDIRTLDLGSIRFKAHGGSRPSGSHA